VENFEGGAGMVCAIIYQKATKPGCHLCYRKPEPQFIRIKTVEVFILTMTAVTNHKEKYYALKNFAAKKILKRFQLMVRLAEGEEIVIRPSGNHYYFTSTTQSETNFGHIHISGLNYYTIFLLIRSLPHDWHFYSTGCFLADNMAL